MLIKPNSIAAVEPAPHRLKGSVGNGKFGVEHPEGCECSVLYSVHHAPWVAYDPMHGKLACDRCKAATDLPLPAVRENFWSKRVYMNFAAIEDDLFKFQIKHENCPPPDTSPAQSD